MQIDCICIYRHKCFAKIQLEKSGKTSRSSFPCKLSLRRKTRELGQKSWKSAKLQNACLSKKTTACAVDGDCSGKSTCITIANIFSIFACTSRHANATHVARSLGDDGALARHPRSWSGQKALSLPNQRKTRRDVASSEKYPALLAASNALAIQRLKPRAHKMVQQFDVAAATHSYTAPAIVGNDKANVLNFGHQSRARKSLTIVEADREKTWRVRCLTAHPMIDISFDEALFPVPVRQSDFPALNELQSLP